MPRGMPFSLDDAREQVAAASRRLAGEGLVHGGAGNVSVRVGDRLAVTPAGSALRAVRAEDVAVVDIGGRALEGTPTSEIAMHLGIYARGGAGAVVHCHAPVATALSTVLDELPPVHYELVLLGGPIRVAPYATFGTPELAGHVLTALEGRSAALMANHGAVTLGATADEAVERALVLEFCCEVYWRAAAVGAPRLLDEPALRAAAAAFAGQRSIDDMSG
jgi:L-fuculose-phosphate aldolase